VNAGLVAVPLILAAGAIVTFWVAAAAEKGGGFHRSAGRWFSRLIYAAAATGSAFALAQLAASVSGAAVTSNRHLTWLVLSLLVVIVAPVQHGVAVIAAGSAPARVRSRGHLLLNLAAVVGAVPLFAAAIVWHAWPFLLVVPAGFVVGLRNMHYAGRASATGGEWEQEHLTSLITAGIALHTACLGLASTVWPNLIGPGLWRLGPWMAPALIGLPAIWWLRK
jgi:hypothetical protein